MVTLNKKSARIREVEEPQLQTHEGAPAAMINEELNLRRSVMATLLWEDSFYESGIDIAKRIAELIPKVKPEIVNAIAVEARNKMKLRHVPLLIAREMARHPQYKSWVASLLERIIQRPDELTEFLSIYWKDGKTPISAQIKKGLARAFIKFNAYSLAKYNRDTAIKLRDVLFMVHAKPWTDEQALDWKKLIDGTLESPDTWEVNLSAGKDKKETWIRLMDEKKLGILAFLRNLRNMQTADVPIEMMQSYLREINPEKALPFRFIAAARYAPRLETDLEQSMFKCLENHEKMLGKTVLLVDISGSMNHPISNKSDLMRAEAAYALSILAREICDDVRIFSFSDDIKEIPSRKGFALRDAINESQSHSGTYLGNAIKFINKNVQYDRLIIFTDEQSHDQVPDPLPNSKGYVVNVAPYKNGVGYGKWNHIDGFSEAIIDYIIEFEKLV